jgi:predicted O-methyltransferase YrrM
MRFRYSLFNYLVDPIFHTSTVLYPSLNQLSNIGFSSIDPHQIILQAFSKKTEPSLVKSYISEYELLTKNFNEKHQNVKLNYPQNYNVADTAALLLYLLVRVNRPKTVLETGVANGWSSNFILNALNANGTGTLYSIDIKPDVGGLVEESLKNRWQLKIINLENAKQEFEQIVNFIESIDLFIHDSDHSYQGQMSEYKAVYPKISAEGIFASDDIDLSWAFVDFCKEKTVKPFFLVSATKIFGLFPRTAVTK